MDTLTRPSTAYSPTSARGADGSEGARLGRRRPQSRGREVFQLEPVRRPGTEARSPWFDPYEDPWLGLRAPGRVLFAVHVIAQEEVVVGLYNEPWAYASEAYLRADMLRHPHLLP